MHQQGKGFFTLPGIPAATDADSVRGRGSVE